MKTYASGHMLPFSGRLMGGYSLIGLVHWRRKVLRCLLLATVALLAYWQLTSGSAGWQSGRVTENSQRDEPNARSASHSHGLCEDPIYAKADALGHFYLDGVANGVRFDFLIDTGATDIVFPRSAATPMRLASLRFTARTSTAGGTVMNAPVNLTHLDIRGLELRDVGAFVNSGGLDIPLLGINWLRRFSVIEIKRDVLILCR
ncbi:MAG TPA: TIGR02281 family clan AA aspartic protease [Lacipirellulaceae bacterium]|nr:TIGR02281 family clan AA aspartic protease [Lacipirellulaceae bacterium]